MTMMKLKSFIKTFIWKFRIKKTPDIHEIDIVTSEIPGNQTEAVWQFLHSVLYLFQKE